MQRVEHQVIYSPERKNNAVGHWSSFITFRMDSSLPSSWFPHLCQVPTDSFYQERADRALFPPSCKPVPESFGSRQLPISLSSTISICFIWSTAFLFMFINIPRGMKMFFTLSSFPNYFLSHHITFSQTQIGVTVPLIWSWPKYGIFRIL